MHKVEEVEVAVVALGAENQEEQEMEEVLMGKEERNRLVDLLKAVV